MLVGCGSIRAEENYQSLGFYVEFGTEGCHVGGLTAASASRNKRRGCCEDSWRFSTEKAVLLITTLGRKAATFHFFVLQMECRYQCGPACAPPSIFIFMEIESI